MVIEEDGGVTGAHKNILLYLESNGKVKRSDLIQGVGCSHTWFQKKVNELVDVGVVSKYQDDFNAVYLLNQELDVSYSADRYLGVLSYMLGVLVVSVVVSLFLLSNVPWVDSVSFALGSLFFLMWMSLRYTYLILMEEDEKTVKIKEYSN